MTQIINLNPNVFALCFPPQHVAVIPVAEHNKCAMESVNADGKVERVLTEIVFGRAFSLAKLKRQN